MTFPGLEMTILKFHDFSRFSMSVRTLLPGVRMRWWPRQDVWKRGAGSSSSCTHGRTLSLFHSFTLSGHGVICFLLFLLLVHLCASPTGNMKDNTSRPPPADATRSVCAHPSMHMSLYTHTHTHLMYVHGLHSIPASWCIYQCVWFKVLHLSSSCRVDYVHFIATDSRSFLHIHCMFPPPG